MKTFRLCALTVTTVALLAGCCPKSSSSERCFENKDIAALMAIDDSFKELSAKVDSISNGLSDVEQYRAAYFLESAYSLVMQCYVARGNPGAPALTNWMMSPRKFGGDNPYTMYQQCPVNEEFAYKVTGKMGNAIYLGVQLYGLAQGYNIPTANISIQEMTVEKDGTFELYISTNRPKGVKNWLSLQKGDHAFIIRQYFDGRVGNVPATLSVVRTDTNPSKGMSYLARLENANRMIREAIMGTIEVTALLHEMALNHYPAKDAQVRAPKYGGALYPTKDNRYEGCWVSLQQGEAMHVHGYLPKNTLYASYVFYDRWYNTPDYPEVNCFRTMNEVVLNADGSFDLYISSEKINHPNWINTGGLYEGSFSSRYMESSETVFPTVEIINIKDIPRQ